jgi:hypothetical protein
MTANNNEEIEFTIRNILGLHLNNFYQENGLSVPCKTRTIAENKIIDALMPFIISKDEELIKSNEELERIKGYLRIALSERDEYILKYGYIINKDNIDIDYKIEEHE